jgi:starch phosphorylase
VNIEDIRDNEVDAGLGNGGLGRLAACFLDSMATLGIPAHGYGIRYDFGIFNQKIVNGQQVEHPDEWLKRGNPWEIQRPEYAVNVRFYGKTYTYHDKAGKLHVQWVDTDDVQAVPYDVPVPGYANDTVNTLRLWSARSTEEFDFEYFNHGDYQKAVESKMHWETISKVLYPNDEKAQGQELRLKQEYFFTAASLADIVRRYKDGNQDISKLHEKVAIQLNDTHPAVAVVEFMRILVDDEDLDWDTAWDVTTKTFAYTNHTVLPEALEKWELGLFGKLLPRHLEIIYEINHRFLREVANAFPGDIDRMGRMSLIDENGKKYIRMANLAIVGSHSVNGVSALHSQLLKDSLFKDFYQLSPAKFNNKTNGITPRRWLLKSNKRLSKQISETIGTGWVRDLDQLQRLLAKKDDASFQKQWQAIKRSNKEDFAAYVKSTQGIVLNPDSIFDVQIKRIHEYKRQMLFAFYVLREYLKLKNDPKSFIHPRTFVFGGKAAPGYRMAKQIIRFVNSIAYVVNHDRTVGDKMKVVFLENYRVSLAEKVFPASDLSEQISLAGYEASGTGCMKFMCNGALTVGTHDGANIEMAEEVGADNFYSFGLKADEVESIKRAGYSPQVYINRNFYLQEIFRLIDLNFFSPLETGIYRDLADNLRYRDPYLVAADFEDYCRVQDIVSEEYKNTKLWTKKSIINVACSGKFSSDRTIKEYADDIWGVKTK